MAADSKLLTIRSRTGVNDLYDILWQMPADGIKASALQEVSKDSMGHTLSPGGQGSLKEFPVLQVPVTALNS